MTSLYFVRHAQPEHAWEDDRTRPLSPEGVIDKGKVTEFIRKLHVDRFISSPYKRSIDTIMESAAQQGMEVRVDERFRERQKGFEGNSFGMFQKRWSDMLYAEAGGESLHQAQIRNIEAVLELLAEHSDENVVIGTHGTALSTILNYFDPTYGYEDFMRIIDYMPYILRLDFNGMTYIGREELLIIEKEFKGSRRADKP